MSTGLGMTESGPFGLFVTNPNVRAGDLGVPAPGLEIKLVDMQGKSEVRYRGPNITPGYWRAPAETAAHFDDEGYFCSGDAVKWIDEDNLQLIINDPKVYPATQNPYLEFGGKVRDESGQYQIGYADFQSFLKWSATLWKIKPD